MVRIRFDGPPGKVAPRFVEVEDSQGGSIVFGSWEPDKEGSDWFLVLTRNDLLTALAREEEAEV